MKLRRWIYENSLLLVTAVLVVAILSGQAVTGWKVYNEERGDLHLAALTFTEYLRSGHFLEATFENWESEFLQMGMYVVLTVWLRQKGSAESKPLDGDEEVDREPRANRKGAPWPVRRGGLALAIYQRSLSIAFFALFLASFALHVAGGASVHNAEAAARGEAPVTFLGYIGTSQCWFESLQNWQSEFVAILAIVGLSIVLRQKGSPESKPVDAPNAETA